jgi:hypothetical protein
MNHEEEHAARSLLKWQRVNALEWNLFYRRKRMGRVIADKDCPGMWRSVLPDGGTLSDMANLSRAKDAVLAQAIREVAYDLSCKRPSKTQQIRGSEKAISSPMRFPEAAE